MQRGMMTDESLDFFRYIKNNDNENQQGNGIEKRPKEFFDYIPVEYLHAKEAQYICFDSTIRAGKIQHFSSFPASLQSLFYTRYHHFFPATEVTGKNMFTGFTN